jgi:hypothetical protein
MADESKPADPRSVTWFKPGQSGNPNGKPKGCKDKLGEAFVQALYDDFQANGAKAIIDCREQKPEAYLTAISRVIPKDINLKGDGAAAFVKILEAISNGMASRVGAEPGQPETLHDTRPAGNA